MQIHVLDPSHIQRDLAPDVLDEHGRPRVMPASFYAQTSQPERSALAVRHGLYCLPTQELIAWLRERIAGRRAIEIGAGNGVIASALGIPATDNCMQADPAIAAHYAALGQPVVNYGPDVIPLDANAAVAQLRPQVVVAAWVTHRYDPARHEAGGNAFGVDEQSIVDGCEEYIFVGNRHVHRNKPIWLLPHELFEFPWLYSRAINGSPDFIAVWRGASKPLRG